MTVDTGKYIAFYGKISKYRFWALFDQIIFDEKNQITFWPNRLFTKIVKNPTSELRKIDFSQKSGNFSAIRINCWKALDEFFPGIYGSGGCLPAVLKPQWIFRNLPSQKMTIIPKSTKDLCVTYFRYAIVKGLSVSIYH